MKNIIKKRNKNGGDAFKIILFVGILFLLIIVGILAAFGIVTIKWVGDNILPELAGLGMAGDTNLTEVGQYTIKPVQTVIGSFQWVAGIGYILAMIGMLGLAAAFRVSGSKWLMGFFFVAVFMIVIASIFVSNIYEDFYDDSGEVGTALHELTILSFFILYSPLVVCVIGFVGGIIMFAGVGEEEGYVA